MRLGFFADMGLGCPRSRCSLLGGSFSANNEDYRLFRVHSGAPFLWETTKPWCADLLGSSAQLLSVLWALSFGVSHIE